MNRFSILLFAVAVSLPNPATATASVSISYPADRQQFLILERAYVSITLAIDAGTVDAVDFYDNSGLYSTALGPFVNTTGVSSVWWPSSVGVHVLDVVARHSSGKIGYDTIRVLVYEPDVNGDGTVNTLDYALVAVSRGKTQAEAPSADIDHDGKVDDVDLQMVVPHLGKREYGFHRGISKKVLENYLSRSVTYAELLHGRGDVDESTRFLRNTGAKFIGRAIYVWGGASLRGGNYYYGEDILPELLEIARPIMAKLHASDTELIVQAGCFEIVTPNVDKIAVPHWVFEAFNQSAEIRNFRYLEMLYPDGHGANVWNSSAIPVGSIPDIGRRETQMWFFYLAKTFIDIGIEAIHFGQVEAMDEHNSSSQQWETVSVHWNEVFSRVRAYAAQYARRKFVLCDAHVPRSKGLALPLAGSQPPTPPYSLLLDFHSCPLPTIQHSLPAWPTFIALTKAATLWYNLVGQSRGGYAPSGWSCQELPYLLELDNSDGKGESWGYDHISWFAQQTEDQRNAWLGYGWNWLLETDRAGHLQMPGSRYVGAPVQSWYWANTAGPAVPTGFSQEETIKGIWSVAEIPGDLNSDHIVDSRDYSMFRASLGKKRGDLGYNFTADYDGDGWVTYSDYQIWYICYKAGASP